MKIARFKNNNALLIRLISGMFSNVMKLTSFVSLNKWRWFQYTRTFEYVVLCRPAWRHGVAHRNGYYAVLLYSVTTASRVAMVTRNQYGGRHTVSARLAVEFSVNVFLSCISCSRSVYILATWENLRYKLMAATDCVFIRSDQEISVRDPVLMSWV